MPKISVIIPAHNVDAYVGEALASVHGQSAKDFEVIVVDDGSTDRTAVILDEFAARFAQRGTPYTVVRRHQGGAGAARNDGLDRASGEFLCFVDADDVLHPEALQSLASQLETDPTLDFIFPFCRHVGPDGEPTGVHSVQSRLRFSARDLMIANPIHTGTGVTIRRERAEAAGRFDTQLPACIDLDYSIRVTGHRENNIAAVPKVLVDYRFRPGQITGDWRRMRKGWELMTAHAAQRGQGLDPDTRNAALARNTLVWSSVAYKHGEMAAARKLAVEMWRRDAAFAIRDSHARIRTAACIATLLPSGIHDRIRNFVRRFQGLAQV